MEPAPEAGCPHHQDERPGPGRAVLRVFILEADEADAESLTRSLTRAWNAPVDTTVFVSVTGLEQALARSTPGVVFCDMFVGGGEGTSVVERVVAAAGSAPVVVLTSTVDPDGAELALLSGAQDYLEKGSFHDEVLARTLRYAMARSAWERENVRINRDLARVHDELHEYVGIVAHDLRAPVRTARLFADRLLAAVDRNDDPTAIASALDGSLVRLEQMVTRLLHIGSLRDRQVYPIEEKLDEIMADVEAGLLPELVASGASLRCVGDGSIAADPVLIRELIQSLVENSIEYRHADRDPVVTVSVTRTESSSILTVSDNGQGVAVEHRQRALRLFQRLGSQPLESPKGMLSLGFGLAYCQRVAELHHGQLEFAEPVDSVGATVRVVLPHPARGTTAGPDR